VGEIALLILCKRLISVRLGSDPIILKSKPVRKRLVSTDILMKSEKNGRGELI